MKIANETGVNDSEDLTPSKKREILNVNSPKGSVGTSASMFPNDLMTQVSQEDEEKRHRELAERQAEAESEAEKNREKKHQHELEVVSGERPKQSFFQNLCSNCMCCCRAGAPSKGNADQGGGDDSGDENVEVQAIESKNTTANAGDVGVEETKEEPVEAPDASPTSSEEPKEGLLARPFPSDKGRKCLVLDLDETLVHSSFQPMDCSFSLPIALGGMNYEVYVLKRPYVDEFIKECAKTYELVVFTASLSEYANPVIDKLDQAGLIKHRLFRESCVLHQGQAYVKDLSRLGRKLKDCIIIDNSPLSYLFDRYNAIACTSWFGDENDTELLDLLPVLSGSLSTVKDVRTMLDGNTKTCQWLINTYGNVAN